jgi:hypothetical protein
VGQDLYTCNGTEYVLSCTNYIDCGGSNSSCE